MSWLPDASGLRFGDYGTVLSSKPVMPSGSEQEAFSLEIWLQPRRTYSSNTIVSFYRPANSLQFSVKQDDVDLTLQAQKRTARSGTITSNMYVDELFRGRKSIFITIVSSEQQTVVYVDGVLARASSQFRLSSDASTGRLVIGTSPVENESWSGQLRGLALYRAALPPSQVLQHYKDWTRRGRPDVTQSDLGEELYLFDERAGRIIHNEFPSGTSLYIPDRYVLLDEKFLEPAWKEFNPSWSYLKSVLINILGFIPFGFFFFAFLSSVRRNRPGLATVMLGAIVSLTIEMLQAYLPTRSSGTTDLITNTFGTYLGVVLFRWKGAFFSTRPLLSLLNDQL